MTLNTLTTSFRVGCARTSEEILNKAMVSVTHQQSPFSWPALRLNKPNPDSVLKSEAMRIDPSSPSGDLALADVDSPPQFGRASGDRVTSVGRAATQGRLSPE